MFICMQRINFIRPFFLRYLQIYCKFVIFGSLGMHSYDLQKRWYVLVENFDVYLRIKNQIHPSPFLK